MVKVLLLGLLCVGFWATVLWGCREYFGWPSDQ